MSWQHYVDKQLMGTGLITKAVISGHDGTIWAKSSNIEPSREELAKMASSLPDYAPLQMSGVHLGGEKFIFLSGTDKVIRCKKNKQGMHCMKTLQAMLVAVYEEPVQSPQVAAVVEGLGDYLISQSYWVNADLLISLKHHWNFLAVGDMWYTSVWRWHGPYLCSILIKYGFLRKITIKREKVKNPWCFWNNTSYFKARLWMSRQCMYVCITSPERVLWYCHVKTLLYNKFFSKELLLLQLFCELTWLHSYISDGLLLMVLATLSEVASPYIFASI